jgi:hypothetical protein
VLSGFTIISSYYQTRRVFPPLRWWPLFNIQMVDRVRLVRKIPIEWITLKLRVLIGHTDGAIGIVLFVMVSSFLCHGNMLFAEGDKEQVLAAMVYAVVVRRWVCPSVAYHPW